MRSYQNYPQPNRPATMGVNGMVSSAHPLASQAGLRVLMDGGNAFDATVATAAALNVVEPYMSGIGGIGMALAYVSRENKVKALNFSGRAPEAAEPSRFSDETKETGILAAMVPGNLAGWLTLHETYGSLDRERLFKPAIDYAENGFPVTHLNSQVTSQMTHLLLRFPTSTAMMLRDGDKAPTPGSRLRLPQLAESLRKIARDGAEVFYRGELAERIVDTSRAMGGLFTMDDLAEYRVEWQEPLSVSYRGYQILTMPPNSSAFQVLQTLKLMEGFAETELHYHDPQSLHLLMEAMKLCITDRIKYGGDPDHVTAPLKALLSEAYADTQRQRIDREQAAIVSGEKYAIERPEGALRPGTPEEFDGGMTTHFAVADRDGNVVTVTQTLGGGFGSGIAVGDTGIFLNNMGSYFDLEEGSPNLIGPGKLVDFVIAPTQTFRDGKIYLSMGTPGSWGILQTTPQLLMNVLDFGMNVQQAIESPRFRYYTGRHVKMEERFPPHVRATLESWGHEVEVLEPWARSVGGAQAIQIDAEAGVFQGGADPRRDGYALGW